MQKRRKKTDAAEWNALVAQAPEVKARSERGEIDDAAMREMFDRIGREWYEACQRTHLRMQNDVICSGKGRIIHLVKTEKSVYNTAKSEV